MQQIETDIKKRKKKKKECLLLCAWRLFNNFHMASPLIVSNKETFCGYSLVANCILSLHFYDLHFQSVVRIGISHLVVFCLWSSLKKYGNVTRVKSNWINCYNWWSFRFMNLVSVVFRLRTWKRKEEKKREGNIQMRIINETQGGPIDKKQKVKIGT